LINYQRIKQFKNFYNYDEIKKHINSEDNKLDKYINNVTELPQELNLKNIIPEIFTYQYIQGDIPNKFEIINKDLFDSILKEIELNKNFYSISTYIYEIDFADNKILSKIIILSKYIIFIP